MNVAVANTLTNAGSTGLDTANLQILEIISHHIFARDTSSKQTKEPSLRDDVIILPQAGIDALQQRMTTALGSRSHGIEMSIESSASDSFLQIAAHAIASTEKDIFVQASKEMTNKLSLAQAGTSGLAGIVFVIRGRIGKQKNRFLAVIKAELHDGFGTGEPGDTAVQYLAQLALTPTQRLYKVGLLLETIPVAPAKPAIYEPSNYRAFLFDHLITATESRSAAAYFYSSFLGMGIQKSSKKLTQDFYEICHNFIKAAPISDDAKWELREALRVELRSNSTIISAHSFATEHVESEELRDSLLAHFEAKGFPKNAVNKDVEYVKSKLRRPRKLAFTSGVKVIIPADATKDTVVVNESNESETTITIHGTYQEE